MRTQRQIVDYTLQKRSVLRAVHAGLINLDEVCDASPYLRSAARFHGEPSTAPCPVCRRENLTYVHYIYGDELKQSAGQARTRAELAMLATRYHEFRVFVVEVCRGCGWNHLAEQYLLGEDGPTAPAGDDGWSGPSGPSPSGPGGPAASRDAGGPGGSRDRAGSSDAVASARPSRRRREAAE